MKRIYLDKEKNGCVVCEKCGRVQRIHVPSVRNDQPVDITCRCAHTFPVLIDQRQHYRKNVRLPGIFEKISPKNSEKGKVIVQDISRQGVGFVTYTTKNINIDDILRLKFVLDDPHNSAIHVRAIVKIVKDQYVGVELVRPNEHIQKTLGFYLMQDGGRRTASAGRIRTTPASPATALEQPDDGNPFRLTLSKNRPAVGFSGNLESLPGASLLRILTEEKKTGVLHLLRMEKKGAICFSKGDVIAVSGNGWRRLGEILLEKRAITPELLDHALELAKASGKRLGEVLVSSGFLSENTVTEILQHHIRESIQDLFDWNEGSFRYQDGAVDFHPTVVRPAVPGGVQNGAHRKPKKREYSRLPVSWPVSILTTAGPIPGEIRNISLTGALVYCRQLPDPKHFHRLSIEIKKYSYMMLLTVEMIRLDVVYVDYQGPLYSIGTRFVEIDENDLQFLSTRVLR
jgi:hypothetical protein